MKVHLKLDSWLSTSIDIGIFDSAYLSEERECIRLFTQCKHTCTCLLKRWYVVLEEGATEVGFLAEYGSFDFDSAYLSGECECIRLFTFTQCKCKLLRRVRLSMYIRLS